MTGFVDQLQKVWPLVTQAPLTFVLLAVSLFISGVVVCRFVYSERVKTLKDRIITRDERISAFQAKLDGASPDEAKRRIDDLEAKVKALTPRRLTEEQSDILKRCLKTSSFSISIAQEIAVDVKKIAGDFSDAFRNAGWIVIESKLMGLGQSPPTGIMLRVFDTQSLTPAEVAASSALTAAGLSFNLQKGRRRQRQNIPIAPGIPPEMPEPDVELVVTIPV